MNTLHFENTICRVLHKRTYITASFAEHLQFQEQITSIQTFWVNFEKPK